jgi:hypothetical protein
MSDAPPYLELPWIYPGFGRRLRSTLIRDIDHCTSSQRDHVKNTITPRTRPPHPTKIPRPPLWPLTETPHPFTNRYGPVNHFYGPLRRPLTLLRTTTDLLRLYGDPLTLLRTVTGPSTDFTDPHKTSSTRYAPHYTTQYGRHQQAGWWRLKEVEIRS